MSCTGSCQSLLQIGLQIVHILNANTETNETIVDATGLADLGGDAGVRHRRRVTNQGFDPAQALRQTEELRLGQQAQRSLLAAADADADHAAEIAHLPARQLMTGV